MNILKKFALIISQTVSTICFTLMLLPSVISLALYYSFASLAIKIQFKDAKLLDFTSAMFALAKEKNFLSLTLHLAGNVEIDKFQSIFLEKVVKREPRFLWFFEKKYGYYFWQEEKEFNIANHIVHHPETSISNKKERDQFLLNILCKTTLRKDLSPWFIHLVPSQLDHEEADGEKSFLFIFTWHHALADGLSMMNYYNRIADDSNLHCLFPSSPKSPSWKERFLNIFGTLILPYYLVSYFFNANQSLPAIKPERNYSYIQRSTIKLQDLKLIKNEADVPIRVVLMSCILAALENIIRRKNYSKKDYLKIAIPVVMWKPNEKLVLKNNFFMLPVFLPVTKKSCRERLFAVNSTMLSYYTCFGYQTALLMKQYGHIIPTFLLDLLIYSGQNANLVSITALNTSPTTIMGKRVLRPGKYNLMVDIPTTSALMWHIVSVEETVTFSITSEKSFASEEELTVLADDFEKEVQNLKKCFM